VSDPTRLEAIRVRNDEDRDNYAVLAMVDVAHVSDIDFLLSELAAMTAERDRLRAQLDYFRPEIEAAKRRLHAGMESETG
jgi:hypothetical protein